MSLDVAGCYEVCCALASHVRSNEIGLVVKYLERNLWEYPVNNHFTSPDSSAYESWSEFLTKNYRFNLPIYFQWDPNSYFFEEMNDENEGDNEGDANDCPRDILVIAFGNTDVYVKVEQDDQPKIRHYMQQNQVHIPSNLDILPKKLCNTFLT